MPSTSLQKQLSRLTLLYIRVVVHLDRYLNPYCCRYSYLKMTAAPQRPASVAAADVDAAAARKAGEKSSIGAATASLWADTRSSGGSAVAALSAVDTHGRVPLLRNGKSQGSLSDEERGDSVPARRVAP